MSEVFTAYENGLTELLDRLGNEHPSLADVLIYQQRLLENIGQARRYGDTETRRAERAQVVDVLNRLALEILGASFNELCGRATGADMIPSVAPSSDVSQKTAVQHAPTVVIGDQARLMYPVTPLGVNLPVQDPPPYLSMPSGYRYLGQLDGLTIDHLYREQDGHVVLRFPEMPGVSKPFLIDKYAVTARQFSDCLNDLLQQRVVQLERHPATDVQCCVDWQGRPLAFDALDRWRGGPTTREPWLHTSAPWGMTCQGGLWQPVPGNELLPATLVTWWGARLYSLWVHRQSIDRANNEVAYLPTIQQWEAAALWDVSTQRQRRYPWGDTWQRKWVNCAGYWADCEVREADWERRWATQPNIYRQTRPLPVASLNEGRSPIGCVQMIGNVWEWCADTPDDGSRVSRVVKGGACLSPQEHCLPDREIVWRAEQGNEYIGFRCVFPLMK